MSTSTSTLRTKLDRASVHRVPFRRALAGRTAQHTPPGAPWLSTVPLPSNCDVVHVADDGQSNTDGDVDVEDEVVPR